MKQFGYSVSRDNTIDMDKADMRDIRMIHTLEPSVNQCIGCGSCTATCSTGQFVNFNIRQIHTLMRRGEQKTLLAEISACMFCGKCQLICPRGVNLRNLILAIHQMNNRNHGQL